MSQRGSFKFWATPVGLAVCLLGLPIAAQALVVDFEDVANGTNTDFSSRGLDFVLDWHLSIGQNIQVRSEQFCGPACPFNGSSSLYAINGGAAVTMSRSGGGTFDLLSFDGAGSVNLHEGAQAGRSPGRLKCWGPSQAAQR